MPEFIPITAGVHFKAAFDVSSARVPKLMTHLRQKFRAWCVNRVGANDPLLHRAWFYVGNNPKVEPAQYVVNDFQLRTVSAPGADPDEPTCWAFEMVHPDAEERARRWSAEITLRKSEDGSVRFTTVVKNWMLANFIGEYPPAPTASAPAYVRSLLDDPLLTCSKGDAALRSGPVVVSNKTCRGVYDQLTSEGRHAPYVLVSHHPATGGVLVPPTKVAAALIGNANVYVLPATSVVDEMNYYLGDALRCEYGSVRVYLPQLDRADPADARHHRYLSAAYIAQHGEDGILRFLTNGLSRNGNTFRLSDLTSFGDIFTERRRHAIRRLATETQAKTEETSLVWEDNQRLAREAAEWESAAVQYETENATLKKEAASLKYRIEEADRVRHRVRDLESQLEGVKKLTSLPTTLAEVLAAVAALFPNRVAVTPEAVASADEYCGEHDRHWCKPEQLAVAWQMAFGLATRLYDLVFVENSNRLEDAFGESSSSFELAMSEGKQTKKDNRLMALRRREFEGREYDISPHVKYGNRKPKLLRLYFAICRETERLVVGHFGDHLENYSTQKQ